jgi:hypothetical protein
VARPDGERGGAALGEQLLFEAGDLLGRVRRQQVLELGVDPDVTAGGGRRARLPVEGPSGGGRGVGPAVGAGGGREVTVRGGCRFPDAKSGTASSKLKRSFLFIGLLPQGEIGRAVPVAERGRLHGRGRHTLVEPGGLWRRVVVSSIRLTESRSTFGPG